jgi:chromosome segregation protein
VDAVRWCLGEQSMRDLRGQRSEDVIYAGPRRSLSFAEVTLTLESETGDHELPWSELAIGRRVHRSGESEYILNGERTRLKDVASALREIDVDAGRYVVVNQGMADSLLVATPAERRALLEHAAGLSAYRTHREEARQKIATTSQNVLPSWSLGCGCYGVRQEPCSTAMRPRHVCATDSGSGMPRNGN